MVGLESAQAQTIAVMFPAEGIPELKETTSEFLMLNMKCPGLFLSKEETIFLCQSQINEVNKLSRTQYKILCTCWSTKDWRDFSVSPLWSPSVQLPAMHAL